MGMDAASAAGKCAAWSATGVLPIVHVPGHTPVAFDSYARDFGIAFQPHLAGHARTHGDVDQFRADHCGQLCCAAAMIFRDHGLEVMRAAA